VSRLLILLALGAVAGLLALNAVAVFGAGRPRPVRAEPAWDSPRTRELVRRACYDCHSNEPHIPWYAWVPPAGFLIARDITEGRSHLNFSEWDRPQEGADEAVETVQKGKMPPPLYRVNSRGRLTPQERDDLIRGLRASLGAQVGEAGERE